MSDISSPRGDSAPAVGRGPDAQRVASDDESAEFGVGVNLPGMSRGRHDVKRRRAEPIEEWTHEAKLWSAKRQRRNIRVHKTAGVYEWSLPAPYQRETAIVFDENAFNNTWVSRVSDNRASIGHYLGLLRQMKASVVTRLEEARRKAEAEAQATGMLLDNDPELPSDLQQVRDQREARDTEMAESGQLPDAQEQAPAETNLLDFLQSVRSGDVASAPGAGDFLESPPPDGWGAAQQGGDGSVGGPAGDDDPWIESPGGGAADPPESAEGQGLQHPSGVPVGTVEGGGGGQGCLLASPTSAPAGFGGAEASLGEQAQQQDPAAAAAPASESQAALPSILSPTSAPVGGFGIGDAPPSPEVQQELQGQDPSAAESQADPLSILSPPSTPVEGFAIGDAPPSPEGQQQDPPAASASESRADPLSILSPPSTPVGGFDIGDVPPSPEVQQGQQHQQDPATLASEPPPPPSPPLPSPEGAHPGPVGAVGAGVGLPQTLPSSSGGGGGGGGGSEFASPESALPDVGAGGSAGAVPAEAAAAAGSPDGGVGCPPNLVWAAESPSDPAPAVGFGVEGWGEPLEEPALGFPSSPDGAGVPAAAPLEEQQGHLPFGEDEWDFGLADSPGG